MLAPSGLTIGRFTSQQFLAHLRTSLPLSLRRVATLYSLSTTVVRHYTDRPVSRPKAHTGRATTTQKPKATAKPTGTAATTSKASSSKAKPKTRGKASPKLKAKPKAKTKAKQKVKAKPKPKPKKRTPKPLTDVQKTAAVAKKFRTEVKALRAKILMPPHRLPTSAYVVLLTEQSRGTKGNATNMTKDVSAQYRSLSTERREHYNHLANENKAKNETQYRRWVESHTPAQVHESNRVRALLLRRTSTAGSKKPHLPVKLKDDREVKRVKNSYNFFYVERFRSGDFSGILVREAAKRIGQEWRELSATQKRPYVDRQANDMTRYEQEVKSVYNRDVSHRKTERVSAS